jgi:putative acetyltransferase
MVAPSDEPAGMFHVEHVLRGSRGLSRGSRMTTRIRPERADDSGAVRALNDAAFGRPEEGELVDRLRAAGKLLVSMVAEEDGVVVGHIAFSRVVQRDGSGDANGAGLAPMAVLPDRQRSGIGSKLVREGLEACRAAGIGYVVVLGHPDYYPRFGFVPAGLFGIGCKWDVPDEVFMVRELATGALDAVRGIVDYEAEFDDV